MAATIDLVLPVNPRRGDDYERMRICLSSLERYLDPEAVGRLFLVVPDNVIKSSVRAWTWQARLAPFRTEILNDRELIGLNEQRRRLGTWYVQQFVKLAVAERVESDFYVTLDADILMTRPTRFEDLVVGGRALTRSTNRAVHASWWRASAELLGTEPRLDAPGMGVTPAVLSTELVRGLLRELRASYGDPWYRGVVDFIDDQKARGVYDPALPSPVPTEYTLYYLFAEKHGLTSRYHVMSDALWCEQQVFSESELADLPARLRATHTDPGRFLVLQSVLGLSPERVWQSVSRELGLVPVSRRA
jgi:hypothetical protein